MIPLVAIIGGFITKWHNTNAKIEMARAVAPTPCRNCGMWC